MKLKLSTGIITLIFIGFSFQEVLSQNWTTHCGNNERNGLSELIGPEQVQTPLWAISNAALTTISMNIYSHGDIFVTSRATFSPYKAVIECRNLKTGSLIWTSPDLGPASILYAMGFNEDAVYAHDYNSGIFYALHISDGSVKWTYEAGSYTFGPMDGVIYTCEGNVIINGALGSVQESTLCLERETGEIVWANDNWFAVTPNETKAAHNDHLYMITGAINQPKKLVAVDINTGENLYYSENLPGDGDQELPISVAPDGTIYFCRDGGVLFAVEDHGTGFNILWTYPPSSIGLIMNYGVDHQGNVLLMDNGKIRRISRIDGTVMGYSQLSVFNSGKITIGADSVIYVNNTEGAYYALSHDLQTTIWSATIPGNYYAGPALSKDGIMVMCGAGTSIYAYQTSVAHSPVTDFVSSSRKIYTGESISFTDQSSFAPTGWQWEFPGAIPSSSSEQHPQNIVYDQPGIYEVTLITSNELGSDTLIKHCYIEVIILNDLTGPSAEERMIAYPNPASENLTLLSDFFCRVMIIDMHGKLVFTDDTFDSQRSIDISSFSPGIYIARMIGTKTSGELKFIIKH